MTVLITVLCHPLVELFLTSIICTKLIILQIDSHATDSFEEQQHLSDTVRSVSIIMIVLLLLPTVATVSMSKTWVKGCLCLVPLLFACSQLLFVGRAVPLVPHPLTP